MTYNETAKWIEDTLHIKVSVKKLRRAAAMRKLTVTRLGHSTVQITPQAAQNYIERLTKKAV